MPSISPRKLLVEGDTDKRVIPPRGMTATRLCGSEDDPPPVALTR